MLAVPSAGLGWLCLHVCVLGWYPYWYCCSKIAEAEAAVSVNEKKWLVMHMHVQLHWYYWYCTQLLGLDSRGQDIQQ
jgi:hypothetical protein